MKPSPILIKEMRSTMRGARTFLGITLFLLFLTGLTLLVYYGVAQESYGPSAATAGRTIFSFVSVVEALMLAVVTPTLTAGAIAGERQKQTFDMLMATPLTPGQVLRGKLLASMNHLLLLMLAGLPINAIVFLFGGLGPTTLLWWLALVVMVLLLLAAIGLLMSTLFKSSGTSTALTYLFCFLFFGVIPLGLAFALSLFAEGNTPVQYALALLALLHPAASLAAILINEEAFNAGLLLPATLPLYAACAGLCLLAADARLSQMTARGQHWRSLVVGLALLALIAVATVYLLFVPVARLVEQM